MNIKQRASSGLDSYGLVVRLTDPVVLEMAKSAGFHFVRIDCEHVYYDHATLRTFFNTARHLGLAAQIRISDLHNLEALLALEPAAICIPNVETAAQAREAVDAIKYPPYGKRSVYGGMASIKYGNVTRKEYEQTANDCIQLIIQIETKTALENIDEILAIPGVDMVASGKADLAHSLGLSGQREHPDVIAAENLIIQKTLEHGKIPTLSVRNAARMRELRDKGVHCFSIGCDVDLCYKGLCECRKWAEES